MHIWLTAYGTLTEWNTVAVKKYDAALHRLKSINFQAILFSVKS